MTTPTELTAQGIAALKAGDKLLAYRLLTQSLGINLRNELAWLWLSGVVGDDAERKYCLEQVLEINPGNEAARRGLLLFPTGVTSKSPLSEVPTVAPPLSEVPTVAPPLADTVRVELDPTIQQHNPSQSSSTTKAVRSSLLVLIFIGLIYWLCVLGGIGDLMGGIGELGSRKVTLYVTGSSRKALVTYGVGGSQSQREVGLPWSIDVDVPSYNPVVLLAQSQSEEGSISCKIKKGTKTIEESSSSGAYVVVTCGGMP